MSHFDYKQTFAHVQIDITKEMIVYKGKTIPAQNIIGIGLAFMDIAKVAIGNALGGVVGGMIAQKSYDKFPGLNKNLSELPKTRFAHMIITYKTSEPGKPDAPGKEKFVRIPLITMNETCIKMIHEIAKVYPGKFIGFGNLQVVEKELKVSRKAAIITVVIVMILLLGFGIYAAMNPGSY